MHHHARAFHRYLAGFVLVVAWLTSGCGPSLQQAIEDSPVDGRYDPPTVDTARCRDAVAHLERKAGIPVHRSEMADWGETNYEEIWIKAGLTSCGELETLAHEVAHLHEPKGMTLRERQMWADAVSYEIVKRLGGYDPRDRYVSYLSTMKPDARIIALYRREIAQAVKTLTQP